MGRKHEMGRRLARWRRVASLAALAMALSCGGNASVESEPAAACTSDDDCSGDDTCNTLIGCDTPRECAPICISAAAPHGYCGCDGRVFIGNAGCPSEKFQPFDDAVLAPDDPGRDVEGTPCTLPP
jgi:hypothetical protein